MPKACVKRFRMGDVEIDVDATEGKTLQQVATDLGMKFDGSAWWINGTRVSAASAATAVIHAGDQVKHAPKGDQGV